VQSARNRAFQLICLLVAVALGVLIIGKKVGAEPAAHSYAGPGDPTPPKPKDKKPKKDAGPDVDAAFDPDAGGLDYAVLDWRGPGSPETPVAGVAPVFRNRAFAIYPTTACPPGP